MTDDRTHERYSIPHAEDLFSDTWAKDDVCPNCGRTLEPGSTQCLSCHQWIGDCGHSCPGCPSPKCVGGERSPSEKRHP